VAGSGAAAEEEREEEETEEEEQEDALVTGPEFSHTVRLLLLTLRVDHPMDS
jgi:hypothetical protein